MSKRQRSCAAHLEALLSLVEKDKVLHKYSLNRLKEGSLAHTRWEKAAQILNNPDSIDGADDNRCIKNGRAWRETWRTQVKFTKFAVRHLKDGMNSLSVFKQRVLAIIEAEVDENREESYDEEATPAKMHSEKIKMECTSDQNPISGTNFEIKKEPTEDWASIEPEITIEEQETPKQQPNVPSAYHIDDLVVTVRSTDLMNLIPVKTVTGDVIFSCGTCTYHNIFKTSEHLIIHHFREHSDKYQVRCKKCDIILANNNILHHAKYHFDAQPGQINDCPNVGPDMAKLLDQASPDNAPLHETSGKTSESKEVLVESVLNRYVCGVCFLNFNKKNHLKEHMQEHWSETEKSNPRKEKFKHNKRDIQQIPPVPLLTKKRHKCHLCAKTFPWSFQLKSHLKSHKTKRFKCSICDKSFTSKQYLVRHHDVHSGRKYPCKLCGEEFTPLRKLHRHMERVHLVDTKQKKREVSQEGPCLCQICGKSSINYSSYKCHLQTHKQMEYRCDHCPKILRKKAALKMHMRHHIESKNHLCTKCGEAFQLPEHLAKHLRRVHKLCEEFECTVCSMKFDKSILLIEHLKEHPDNPRPFQCMDCSKAFVHAHALRKHSREIHTIIQENQFKCHMCPMSFIDSHRLKVHLPTHTKPFKCTICPKAFARETILKAHLDWHAGKRYKCDECGKEFTQARVLAGHMNKHTGAKPYHCLICDMRFPHGGTYYYHLTTVHQ